MADYANCPTCHGPGVIPVEQAERIEAHATVNYDAAREEQRQREAQWRRAEVERRKAAAEQRLADLLAVLHGGPDGDGN